MTLSIATTSVPGDLRTKLASIAEAGFSGVELYEPDFTGFYGTADDVRKLAADNGLRINVLQPFFDLEGHEGAAHQNSFERLERKLDLMQELGTDLLLVGAAVSDSASTDEDKIIADLSKAAEMAERHGLKIAYLALPWATAIKTEMDALRIVQAVGNPHLGLALNSFYSLADGSKPARLRDIPGESVLHVQLSDSFLMDADSRTMKRNAGLLPGQGRLNLAGFVRVISRLGFAGPWSLGRIGDSGPQRGGRLLAADGYRSLVNLLDEVSRTDPDLAFDIPQLPERVYASGFEFIEFAVDETAGDALRNMLSSLSFRMERRHISKSVELWRQGAINIVVNSEKEGFAQSVFLEHGPSVCDMGLRVGDAAQTVARASALGAPVFSQPVGTGELDIPAIKGVGGNIVHFIDEKSNLHRVWDIEFEPVAKTEARPPAGLRRIDHVAQTMRYEEMQSWLLYYCSTFEMERSSVVDVSDPLGIVHSQVIESPEGEVRLNLNGAVGQRTFAGSFLAEHVGAGVQHIALLTDDIFETSERLKEAGFPRLTISPNYYADLRSLFGLEDALIEKLQSANILYDRMQNAEYFQIYSQSIFTGFFFEIIERRHGYAGYGARNAPFRLAAQTQYHREATNEKAGAAGQQVNQG